MSICRFVWGKKIERDLLRGKDVREFTATALEKKHQERMVSSKASSLKPAPTAVAALCVADSVNAIGQQLQHQQQQQQHQQPTCRTIGAGQIGRLP
jgi:hypothetical protein